MLASVFLGSASRAAELPEFSAGGFARVSVVAGGVSEDRHQSRDVRLHVPSIPVSGQSPDRDRVNVHAKDSRGWVRAVTESPFGQVEMLVEADLAESSRRYDVRLRHAYIKLGRLLVGQTYSVFINTSSLADVEAGYALANMITRHDVVRWQQPINPETDFTIAIEEPQNKLHPTASPGLRTAGENRRPDLTMRVDRRGSWGNVSLSMAVREIATTGVLAAGEGDQSDTGTAFSLAGRVATGEADNLRFVFSYGDALSRYLTSSIYADAAVTETGELDLATTHAGTVAWQHFWSPRWRSTIAANYSRTDTHELSSAGLTREARSAHLNLIWTPTNKLSLGIEYIHAWREAMNGDTGDLNRLQWSARYNF